MKAAGRCQGPHVMVFARVEEGLYFFARAICEVTCKAS